MRTYLLPLLTLALTACATTAPLPERALSSESPRWTEAEGVEIGSADRITILRADPRRTPLVLLHPPETVSQNRARLADGKKYLAVTNASMFAKDGLTSVGYMRNYDYVNNPRASSKMQGYLMFNPKDPEAAPVRVAGKAEAEAYHTAFQTYRMWDPKEGILWKRGASNYHQIALVGVDDQSRVLFFFHPEYSDVHELVEKILGLGLEIRGLLYLDGGNHGTLALARALGESTNTWIRVPNALAVKPASAPSGDQRPLAR